MNWGKGIVLSFIVFAGIIITMVTISMKQDVNLVAPNYYEEEIAYQDQIDRISNFEALEVKPVITKKGDQIELSFPQEVANSVLDGEILFFRPSDRNQDIKAVLKLDGNQKMIFPVRQFSKGLWMTKLRWRSSGNIEYFTEKRIVI